MDRWASWPNAVVFLLALPKSQLSHHLLACMTLYIKLVPFRRQKSISLHLLALTPVTVRSDWRARIKFWFLLGTHTPNWVQHPFKNGTHVPKWVQHPFKNGRHAPYWGSSLNEPLRSLGSPWIFGGRETEIWETLVELWICTPEFDLVRSLTVEGGWFCFECTNETIACLRMVVVLQNTSTSVNTNTTVAKQ